MNPNLRRRMLAGAIACAVAGTALASSHREAPFITTRPKVDGTDFYMRITSRLRIRKVVRTTTPWTRTRCTRS